VIRLRVTTEKLLTLAACLISAGANPAWCQSAASESLGAKMPEYSEIYGPYTPNRHAGLNGGTPSEYGRFVREHRNESHAGDYYKTSGHPTFIQPSPHLPSYGFSSAAQNNTSAQFTGISGAIVDSSFNRSDREAAGNHLFSEGLDRLVSGPTYSFGTARAGISGPTSELGASFRPSSWQTSTASGVNP
jgi:hypothetical protein